MSKDLFSFNEQSKSGTKEGEKMVQQNFTDEIANQIKELSIKNQDNDLQKGKLLSSYWAKYPNSKTRQNLLKDPRVNLKRIQAEKLITAYNFTQNEDICQSTIKIELYHKIKIEKFILLIKSNLKNRFVDIANFIFEQNLSVKKVKLLLEKVTDTTECSLENILSEIKTELQSKKNVDKKAINTFDSQQKEIEALNKQVTWLTQENARLSQELNYQKQKYNESINKNNINAEITQEIENTVSTAEINDTVEKSIEVVMPVENTMSELKPDSCSTFGELNQAIEEKENMQNLSMGE